jgi:hypothetical protein
LGDLIRKGEVAWLSTEEMMKASEAAGTPHSGAQHLPEAAEIPMSMDGSLNNALPALLYRVAYISSSLDGRI